VISSALLLRGLIPSIFDPLLPQVFLFIFHAERISYEPLFVVAITPDRI